MFFPGGSIKEGFFENNIYKGQNEEIQIPTQLSDPNFTIMSMAPKGVLFSEEMMSMPGNYAKQPNTSHQQERLTHQQRFMTANEFNNNLDETIKKNEYYSVPLKQAKLKGNKKRTYYCPQVKKKDKRLAALTLSPNQNNERCFTSNSRSLLGRLSTKQSHIKEQNMTTIYTCKLRHRKNRQSKKIKAWIPSGIVHYAKPYRKSNEYS